MELPKKRIRQDKILMELQLHPQMKVMELADRLEVSQETIRRDLAALQKQGKLERTFGGAIGLSAVVPGIAERQKLMIPERDRIASCAVSFIQPNDVIIVGGGSTTLRFAMTVAALEFPITVLTHSLPFAISVAKNPLITVEILPGNLNPDEGLTSGSNTINAIRGFSAHKAFVGASGVNETGLYALLEPGQVYRAIIEAAQQAFILVDSSKFGAMALARYHGWAEKMTVISDSTPSPDILRRIHEVGAQLIVKGTEAQS